MEYEWGINTWNLIEIVGVLPAGVNFFRTVLWCWETTIVHPTFSVDRGPRMCLRVFTLFPESITGCVWVFTLFPESRTGCFWECSPYFGNQEQSVVKSLHSIPGVKNRLWWESSSCPGVWKKLSTLTRLPVNLFQQHGDFCLHLVGHVFD